MGSAFDGTARAGRRTRVRPFWAVVGADAEGGHQ